MFKGTAIRASGEFSKLVARNGGRENAFTSQDYTGYFQTVAVDRLPLVMELEADRMRNLLFEAKEVEPERLVILEERRQRTDVNPQAILREHVNAALFLNHPYRKPIIGWAHEIKTLTIDDLKTFYRRWYAPNNAILVVAGDITAAQLRPLAERFYGAIPSQPMAERTRPQEPPRRIPAGCAARCAGPSTVVEPILSGAGLSLAGWPARLCPRGPRRDLGRRRHQPNVPGPRRRRQDGGVGRNPL